MNGKDVSLRLFACSWLVFCLGVAYWSHVHDLHALLQLMPLCAAAGFIAGIISPRLMQPLQRGCERLLHPVGNAISLLLLAAAYFLIFTPYARLMTLAGRDALRLRKTNQRQSGWTARDLDKQPDYTRQY